MPVLDHEVHESVKHDDSKRYGCHNRKPFAYSYVASDWGNKKQIVNFVMSRECRFDMSLKDPWCEGCKHRGSGEAYDQKIREQASIK